MKNRLAVAGVALALAAMATNGGARLTLAMHDRADPNPHQVQIAAEVAGVALALLVTWTERVRKGG